MSAAGRPAAPGLEPEDPAIVGANLRIGVRLLASAVVFLFMAFVFAFFYLRELNSNNDFHPSNVNPQQGYGIGVLVGVILTAVVFDRARRGLAAGSESTWRSISLAALLLALAVFVVSVIELVELPFKTTAGGFASVFWGWTALWLLCWLGGIYWLQTLVAETRRGFESGDSQPLQPSADALLVYLYTLVGIEVIAYICLYLIK
jgi:heme/copper-type cytochrome/quinol oxidase subunit 3